MAEEGRFFCIFAGKSEVKVINFINFLALKDLFRGEREERMTDEGRYLILSSVVGASTGNSFTSCITNLSRGARCQTNEACCERTL